MRWRAEGVSDRSHVSPVAHAPRSPGISGACPLAGRRGPAHGERDVRAPTGGAPAPRGPVPVGPRAPTAPPRRAGPRARPAPVAPRGGPPACGAVGGRRVTGGV